jgi:hypothetical protein
MTMQVFGAFKEKARAALAELLKEATSPVRGKSWSQLLQSYLDTDASMSTDQDMQALEVPAAIEKLEACVRTMKEYHEKTVPMWKVKDVKQANFLETLKNLRTSRGQFAEALEEAKQIHSIVKEYQAGLRREQNKVRKQGNYKHSKYAKMLQANGYPEAMSKCLARAAAVVCGEGAAWQSFFGKVPHGIEVYTEHWSCFSALAGANEGPLSQEAQR